MLMFGEAEHCDLWRHQDSNIRKGCYPEPLVPVAIAKITSSWDAESLRPGQEKKGSSDTDKSVPKEDSIWMLVVLSTGCYNK